MGVRVERFDGLIGRGRAPRRRLTRAAARRAGARAAARRRSRHASAAACRPRPGSCARSAGFIAELQVRRVTPARLSGARQWAAADGAGAPAAEVWKAVRGVPAGARADRARRRRAAGGAGARRVAARAGAVGTDARAVLRLRRPRATAARRDRDARRGRGSERHGVADLRARPRRLRRARRHVPGARAAGGASTASSARAPTTTQRRRAGRAQPPGALAVRARRRPRGARRAVRLLEGGGERAELELVARGDRGAARRRAWPARRSPSRCARRAPRADLLEEVFAAAGIPYALERRRPFARHRDRQGADRAAALRAAARTAGRRRERARDLLAWLRAPGLLERPELADRLEARRAAHGRRRAPRRPGRCGRSATGGSRRSISCARPPTRGPVALIERATRELEWLFCAPRRGRGERARRRRAREARALVAGRRRAGASCASWRASRPGARAGRRGRSWRSALERVEFFSGEPPAPGSGRRARPAGALRARRVAGAVRVRPAGGRVSRARARPQPFLAEEAAARWPRPPACGWASPRTRWQPERYLLYAAVSRPRSCSCLSWHVADDDGAPTARSLFVDDVCDLFEDSLREAAPPSRPLRRGRAARARTPPRRCRRARRGWRPLRDERAARPSSRDAHLVGVLARDMDQLSGALVRGAAAAARTSSTPSPSRSRAAALAHAALEGHARGPARRDRLGAPDARRRLELAPRAARGRSRENEADFPLSVAPERRPGVRRRLQADLERYLEHAAELESPLEPGHLELGFGFAPRSERAGRAALPGPSTSAGE